MTSAEIWINRELRRLRFGAFLERATEWLAAFLFVFGGAVLIVKQPFPRSDRTFSGPGCSRCRCWRGRGGMRA